MGVTSVLVDNGVTIEALKEGLINHTKKTDNPTSNFS